MNQDIKTLALAKVYENQGYFTDAHHIYSFLDEQETSDEIKAGLRRMEEKLEEKMKETEEVAEETIEDEVQGSRPEEKIAGLFEKWLNLMVLKQRLDTVNKLKARCVQQ